MNVCHYVLSFICFKDERRRVNVSYGNYFAYKQEVVGDGNSIITLFHNTQVTNYITR